MIAVDISTELSADNFHKQLNFLSNQVFTDEWTNLERFVLVHYNQVAFRRAFSSEDTAADVRKQLSEEKQSRSSDIARLFANLDSWQQRQTETGVHLIVFVSRIDQAAVDGSFSFVQSLKDKNYEITFVAMGAQLDAALFAQLSPNLIEWNVDGQNVPSGWYQQFRTAYGCGDEPHDTSTHVPSTSSPTPKENTCPTLGAQTPTPIVPFCKSGTFAVMQDMSGVSLSARLFYNSFAFVQRTLYYRIYGKIEGFWWGYYENGYSYLYDFSDYTPEQFEQYLVRFLQYDDDATLIDALSPDLPKSTSGPITLIVFISKMDEDIVTECKQAAQDLRDEGVRLVLIALNPGLNETLMAELTGSRETVQFWDPYYQAEPFHFEEWFDYTLECPIEEPFLPCADHTGLQINFFFDLNNQLITADQFNTVKNFLTSQLFDGWNHVERIAATFFCGDRISFDSTPGDYPDYAAFTSHIDAQYTEYTDSCELWWGIGWPVYYFATYYNLYKGITYYNQAYIAFVGSLSSDDVSSIQRTTPYLHGPLTIVALNEGVKTNATSAGYNVIDWSDSTKKTPDNWKQQFWTALGCEGNPSGVS